MRCDIIIPVWNQLEITRNCINSIIQNTAYPYRLIIIDNASDKETEWYLKSLNEKNNLNLKYIRNDENIGFVKAVNQGIKLSDAPYLCIMNNDTIAADGWLKEMVDVMEGYPQLGLVNPSSNTSGQFPGKDESIDEYALGLRCFKGQIQELYTCRGFCMLLRRAVVEKIGILDEGYHIGYFDDTDYCKRAQEAGYRTARAKAAYVYHKENISFKELDDNEILFKNNEKIFFERWGRPVRVAYFIDRINSKNRINDIAISAARSGHQVLIFLKRGLVWPVSLDHFDIRRCDINTVFFGIVSIYKILKRKKKKKIDIILTDNRIFGNFLKMIKNLHGADIVIGPDRENVLELLKAKSRQF